MLIPGVYGVKATQRFTLPNKRYSWVWIIAEISECASSGDTQASFEGQPAFGVVDEDLVHLVLRDAPPQHLGHDVLQDVRVAVASELGEPVLGVDVVGDHDLVLVALLHQERQAERQQSKRWEPDMTDSYGSRTCCNCICLHVLPGPSFIFSCLHALFLPILVEITVTASQLHGQD